MPPRCGWWAAHMANFFGKAHTLGVNHTVDVPPSARELVTLSDSLELSSKVATGLSYCPVSIFTILARPFLDVLNLKEGRAHVLAHILDLLLAARAGSRLDLRQNLDGLSLSR